MCNRVQLVVDPLASVVEVDIADDFATIRIPLTIDATRLGSEIGGFVDADQHECATRLWADDSYSRNFGYLPQGITISCATVY
jgi:hypothetical protein